MRIKNLNQRSGADLNRRTNFMRKAHPFAYLRNQVLNIRKATEAGTKSFEQLAKMHGSNIFTCRYNEIGYIWCDTMCIKDGKTIITEQNLQYYPAKVRYFYSLTKTTKKLNTHTREELVELANSKNFSIELKHPKKRLVPGKVSGHKLDFPKVYNPQENIEMEVSWNMVERIVSGEIHNVIY